MKRPPWRRIGSGALPLLWTFALSVLLTWPMVLRPGAAALGSQSGDGMKHLWTLWWMRSSVWDGGAFPFHTLRVNFPVGMDLYPIEPLNGLVAVALPFIDVVSLSNLLVLGNLTLTGLAGYFMGRVLTGSRIAGLVAATLLQGSAIMAFFVHVGVGELTHLWWLPLGMGCLVKARETLQWRWFGALSASLVGAMLSCFYLGFFLALAVLVWAVCSLLPMVLSAMRQCALEIWEGTGLLAHASWARMSRLREKGRANSLWSGLAGLYALVWVPISVLLSVLQWMFMAAYERRSLPKLFTQYALAATLAVGVVWPVTQQFAASYKTGDVPEITLSEYIFVDHGQPVTDPAHERLDLSQLVTRSEADSSVTDPNQQKNMPPVPGANQGVDSRKKGAYGGGRYLGWFAIFLAGIGLLRSPRKATPWVLVGATGVLFAMGTYYTVDGLVHSVVLSPDQVDGMQERDIQGKVQLPLLWLNRVLGYLAEPLNFPVRFLAIVSVALAAMGALAAGAMRWPERWLERIPALPQRSIRGLSVPTWPLIVLGLSILSVVDVARGQQLDWPWARFTIRPATELQVLRDEPDLAVVDLGLSIRSDEENRFSALASQIAHSKALNAVPVERIEFFARDGAFFVQALQFTRDIEPLYQGGEGSVPGQCSDGRDNDGNAEVDCADPSCKRYTSCPAKSERERDPCEAQVEDTKGSFPQFRQEDFYRGDFALLRDAGFGWFVVSYRSGSENLPPSLLDALNKLLGDPVVEGPGIGAWAIPEEEVSAEELATWSADHQSRISCLALNSKNMGQMATASAPPRP